MKASSFQLPNSEALEIVIVRLADGRLEPRRADQLIARPTPPQPK